MGARIPKSYTVAFAGVCLVVALGTSSCSPAVMLAGAALGSLGGGSSGSTPPASGIQGIGAPSLAQNANTTSPVQNAKPTGEAIRDVLDHADNQSIRESCVESLPPEAKLPVTECTTRLSCIPGVSRALMMRTCPADMTLAQSDTPQERSKYAGPEWRWSASDGL